MEERDIGVTGGRKAFLDGIEQLPNHLLPMGASWWQAFREKEKIRGTMAAYRKLWGSALGNYKD